MGFFKRDGDEGSARGIAQVVKASPGKEHKDRTRWKFITLVRPDSGEKPFGALFYDELPHSVGSPGDWRQIPVVYDPHKKELGTVTVDLARLGSVDLTTKTPPEVRIGGRVVSPGARWIVPHECPNCGAVVDQAKQGMQDDPQCEYCHRPLPVEAAPTQIGMTGFSIHPEAGDQPRTD